MRLVNCSVESANTTRPRPDRSMAPVHMPHGWQLVYIVDAAAAPGVEFARHPPGHLQLGMRGDVGAGDRRVLLLDEHVAIRPHQQ